MGLIILNLKHGAFASNVTYGTQLGIGVRRTITPVLFLPLGSYSMIGPSFHVTKSYDALVKNSVGSKQMTVQAGDFIEKLFPQSALKTGEGEWIWSEALKDLRATRIFDTSTTEWKWTQCPDLNTYSVDLESKFAAFLNSVAKECARYMGIGKSPEMLWTAKYSTNVLPWHPADRIPRKPDLALFTNGTHDDWRCIRSISEMTSHWSQSTNFAALRDQVSVKSAIAFAMQDNRNFVIAIGFAKYDMIVYKFDRGGLIQCEPFSITHDRGWEYFARVIYCLGYGDMKWFGYDSSVQLEPQLNAPRYMAMQCPLELTSAKLTYVIESRLHLTKTLFGHGSNVRRVRHLDTDQRYIVKDTWHNVARPLTEGQILHVIREIPNVPKIKEEYMVGEDQFSSTFHSRSNVIGCQELYNALQGGLFQDRVHLRLLMEEMPIQLISHFKTRAELALALIDCIIAHKEAFDQFRILHRDIHIGNMYIKNSGESGQTGGVLGDWGFAECQDISKVYEQLKSIGGACPRPITTNTANSPSSDASSSHKSRLNPWPREFNIGLAERMGNTSCASIRMMRRSANGQHDGHRVSDDLESFFYVIIIIMIAFKAPGESKDDKLQRLNLDDIWWKLSTMKLNVLWFETIANNFSPYFACWNDPIARMREKIFCHYDIGACDLNQIYNTVTDGVNYADILKILDEMVQVGTEADKADSDAEAVAEQCSPADTETISDVASTSDDDLALLFPLEMVDKRPDDLDLTSATPATYTHLEKLDVASSLIVVAASSELPEGIALPPYSGYMPSRDDILRHTRHVLAPQTLDTGELPSTVTEFTPSPAVTTIRKRKASTAEVVAAKKARGEVVASTHEVVTV